VTQEPATRSVTVRAPQRALDGATQFILDLDSSRPQVVLDVQVLQVDRSLIRDWGLDIPNSFQLINIPAGALLALGGQNIQDLINQLIAGGGINQSTSTAISALLAQLQGQQKSIFSTPLATFGGGTTLFGISMGTAVAHLALNDSYVTTLEHATLRAAQGDSATLHVGTRFPILNATFAPIFNSPAIAGAIADQSFQPAFPSFNYEDLGVNLKAKPIIHPTNEISLEVELQVRALSGTAVNGVPVISNREYKGSISLKDGEPAVVAGMVSVAEQRSAHGIPGFGQAPALSQVAAANNKQENDDELLVVITPHIVNASEASTTEIYLSPSR
jgi:type II secretory pathway component GspD/PulD (secretin)